MGKKDPRVDAYIDKAAPFAQPILKQIRSVVHDACSDVEETLKWRMPTFMYKGMLCGMAAFKQHTAFGFWKSKLILTPEGGRADESWGQFGRITHVSQLPPRKTLAGYVKKAMELNEGAVKVARPPKHKKPPVRLPADLKAALARNKKAMATYEGFSPSHRREYVEWITEAKTDATRSRRVATAVAQMAQGKAQNWKYERKLAANS